MDEDNTKGLSNVFRIDASRIEDHLRQIVRGSVEETLNSLLEAEADRLCNAGRHERSEARHDTRAGRSERKLHTSAGEVQVQGAKASQADASTTAIIERYRRRARSVEEALIGDVSGWCVGTPGRGHHRGPVGHAGEPQQGLQSQQEALLPDRDLAEPVDRGRTPLPLSGRPYLYLDGIVLKRSWAGEVRNVSLLVAVAVKADGYREILGSLEGAKEDKKGWSAFLKHLKERGLTGVAWIVSDACRGRVESATEFYPDAQWQRCVVHWMPSCPVPTGKMREVALMLKAIHAQESREAARAKATRPNSEPCA